MPGEDQRDDGGASIDDVMSSIRRIIDEDAPRRAAGAAPKTADVKSGALADILRAKIEAARQQGAAAATEIAAHRTPPAGAKLMDRVTADPPEPASPQTMTDPVEPEIEAVGVYRDPGGRAERVRALGFGRPAPETARSPEAGLDPDGRRREPPEIEIMAARPRPAPPRASDLAHDAGDPPDPEPGPSRIVEAIQRSATAPPGTAHEEATVASSDPASDTAPADVAPADPRPTEIALTARAPDEDVIDLVDALEADGAIRHLRPNTPAPTEAEVEALLRPMLRDWLDAHLPAIVERLAREEMARARSADD